MDKKAEKTYLGRVTFKERISDSFVDYDGYSTFSKRSLPTVVDIIVI